MSTLETGIQIVVLNSEPFAYGAQKFHYSSASSNSAFRFLIFKKISWTLGTQNALFCNYDKF
jgi:hypothetical protein